MFVISLIKCDLLWKSLYSVSHVLANMIFIFYMTIPSFCIDNQILCSITCFIFSLDDLNGWIRSWFSLRGFNNNFVFIWGLFVGVIWQCCQTSCAQVFRLPFNYKLILGRIPRTSDQMYRGSTPRYKQLPKNSECIVYDTQINPMSPKRF